MARTAITTGLAKLSRDAGIAAPTPQAADASSGNYVPFTVGSSYGAHQVVLRGRQR